MASIKVNTTGKPITGKVVTFTAPCNCDQVTDGLVINGETYTVCDAMGECVTGNGGAWIAGAQISVVLDCENKKAFIQNAASPNLKDALQSHIDNQNNPHNVTADQVAVTENVVNAIKETGNWSVDGVLAQLGSMLFGGETLYRWNKSKKEVIYTSTASRSIENSSGQWGARISWYYSKEISVGDDGAITLVNYQSIYNQLAGSIDYDALNALLADGYYLAFGSSATLEYSSDLPLFHGTSATITKTIYTTPSTVLHVTITNFDLVTASASSELLTDTDPNAYTDGYVDEEGWTYNALDPITAFVPRIQTGSYRGTGTCGSANPCRLTFSFVPKFIAVRSNDATGNGYYESFWISGMTTFNTLSATVPATLTDNTFSWYNTSSATNQLNESGKTYYWVAIG